MSLSILTIAIRHEADVVTVRQRSRQVARLLGFDNQDQTRIATAVSEIARNAFRYAGGGKVEFIVEGRTAPQLFLIQVTDQGRGIPNLNEILEGRYRSETGMGLGIIGSKRLMDQFDIESCSTGPAHGTKVWLKKVFARRASFVTPAAVAKIAQELAVDQPKDALFEVERQNQELLGALDELRKKQEDLARSNRELQDTNRGVVALYAELNEKADHLRRADDLKSKFLSNMSHEFRSPLNSILALTGLLLGHSDGLLNEEQTAQVGYIRKAADDLYELVNDLLDLAKVEAGKIEVKAVLFEVNNLFGALRGMLRPLFLNQSVALIFEDCDGLPDVYSDEGKISQILRNFLSNALKFTERGEVRVSAAVNGDRIVFSVSDTGIGIAPEDLGRIFQDFVQVDGPLQRKVRGTGLGLPLSKKLAVLLRGDVGVESIPGKGSTFSLEIPIQWKIPATTSVAQPLPVEENAEGIPVLIIENRPDTLEVYRKWLKNSEFRAAFATTVREAEQAIALDRPALIVLDILLDGEDTWHLLASLKNSPDTKDIRILVVTTTDDSRKAYHLGADDYLLKPITRNVMLHGLQRLARGVEAPQVLIIDDDEKDRYLLKRRLKDSGLRVVEASSGVEGIARAQEGVPRMIFLDLKMPEMDGYQVLKALKSDPRTASIAVVVHTSSALDEEDIKRLGDGPAAILYKDQSGQDLGFEAILSRFS